MEQFMEPNFGTLPAGPRHARPVTLRGRLLWALDKGPGRWTWKTNLWAVLIVLGVLVGVGLAVAVTTMVQLFNLTSR